MTLFPEIEEIPVKKKPANIKIATEIGVKLW